MFCRNCGAELQENQTVCSQCGANQTENNASAPKDQIGSHDKILIILLCFFLGGFGVHNFHMGETKKGVTRIIPAFVIMYILLYLLDTTCIIKYFTNIPCPGCGLTRAYLALFKLDLYKAFHYHPLFWTIPILFLYYLFDGKLFKNKAINNLILIGIILLFTIEDYHWITLNVILFHFKNHVLLY